MATFQSLYTQIQIHGPHDRGLPLKGTDLPRIGRSFLSTWAGKVGDPQVLPTYLGFYGIASIICGVIAIEIIGLNMWAAVNWNPVAFIRGLAWHRLDPPTAEYGFNPFEIPLVDGGWWILAGFFLTASILLWWLRMYTRAVRLGMGTHVA